MMNKSDNYDRKLIVALRKMRKSEPELGPSRLELERRKLMASIAEIDQAETTTKSFRGLPAISWAGGAAVVALAVLVYFVGDVQSYFNTPSVSLAGVWQLELNDTIAQGASVRVPPNAKATLVLDDGTMIWADAGTVFSVADPSGARINLKSGRIMTRVQPRDSASKFEIITSDAEIQVLGTIFSVTVDNEQTTVRLHKGSVKLTSHNRTVMMHPGHQIVASQKGIISMEVFDDGQRVTDMNLGDLQSISGTVLDNEKNTVIAAGAVVDEEDVLEKIEEIEPSIVLESTFKENENRSKSSYRGSGKSGSVISDKLITLRKLWLDHNFAQIIEETESVELNPNMLFYRAKALSRLGKWFMAGETFAAVAGMSPSKRSEALYLSSNAYNKARRFDRGLDMAKLTIDNGGTNADHAWRLKIGALSGLGKYMAAAAAADEYLINYPTGAHVSEALFSRGTGLRLSKRWSEAADSYRRFITRGAGSKAMRDDAAFYLAYCLIKIRQATSARKALRQYLSNYPTGRHAEQTRALLAR